MPVKEKTHLMMSLFFFLATSLYLFKYCSTYTSKVLGCDGPGWAYRARHSAQWKRPGRI